MIDLVGHLGYIVLVVGLILAGRGIPAGWFLRAVGETIWIVVGLVIGMTSVWVWGIVFAGIDLYNWKHATKT